MKKYSIYLMLLSISLVFYNCEEQENVLFDNVNGQTLIQFASSSTTLAVEPTGVSSRDLVVTVTTLSNSDRTMTLEVDPSSTATSDQYSITDIVIPAGEYSGTGQVIGNYDNIPNSGSVVLVINLLGIQGADSVQSNTTFTVTLERFCPLVVADFLGTYTAIGSFNDPGNLSSRPDIVVTAGPVANTITLTNVHASGRQAILEMDYSDTTSPKLIHRSFEFGANFQSSNFTYGRPEDQANNTFNTCQKTMTLRFYRSTNGSSVTSGGEYNYILTKQ